MAIKKISTYIEGTFVHAAEKDCSQISQTWLEQCAERAKSYSKHSHAWKLSKIDIRKKKSRVKKKFRENFQLFAICNTFYFITIWMNKIYIHFNRSTVLQLWQPSSQLASLFLVFRWMCNSLKSPLSDQSYANWWTLLFIRPRTLHSHSVAVKCYKFLCAVKLLPQCSVCVENGKMMNKMREKKYTIW